MRVCIIWTRKWSLTYIKVLRGGLESGCSVACWQCDNGSKESDLVAKVMLSATSGATPDVSRLVLHHGKFLSFNVLMLMPILFICEALHATSACTHIYTQFLSIRAEPSCPHGSFSAAASAAIFSPSAGSICSTVLLRALTPSIVTFIAPA